MPPKVAEWNVPLISGIKKIELFHGKFLGGRTITVDGEEVCQRTMSMETKEKFKIDSYELEIEMEKVASTMRYFLKINGQDFQRFQEDYARKFQIWEFSDKGINWRIVLDKVTMSVYANGAEVPSRPGAFSDEFTTVARFALGMTPCSIVSKSGGSAGSGLAFTLIMGETVIGE